MNTSNAVNTSNTVLIGNYTPHDVEAELIEAPMWWHKHNLSKTASGYGTKIETRNKVDFAGRKRRVYVDVFGNSGHCYVIVRGEKITVR